MTSSVFKLVSPVVSKIRWVLKGRSGAAATIQTLLSKILIIAVNVATGVITARTLGPEGRGEQAAMILWPQFLAFAMTLGLPSALLFNLKRYPDKESELFSAALLLGFVIGVVASLTGIIFIPQWLIEYSAEVIHIAQWFMLTAPLGLLWLIFMAALEAHGNFTLANHLRYLSPVLTLIVLSGLAMTQTLTPLTAGLAYLLPSLPIFLWLLIYLWKIFQPRWQSLWEACRQLLNYGLRSYGVDLMVTLAGQLDQALVIGLLSPTSMGVYIVALSLSRMLNVFQSAIVVVLFPKASARPITEVVALVGRAVRVSTTLAILAGIFVILFGTELLRILYGPEFVESVTLVRILVIEVTVSGAMLVLAQAFMALGRPGMVTVFQASGLVLSVPLLVWLIPVYGLVGAGLALLIATTTRLFLVLLSYPLILKVRPPNLLITREDFYFLKQRIFEKT